MGFMGFRGKAERRPEGLPALVQAAVEPLHPNRDPSLQWGRTTPSQVPVDPDLPRQLAAFVLDDGPDGCLTDLWKHPWATATLGGLHPSEAVGSDLYQALATAPAPVVLRWARVVDASLGPYRSHSIDLAPIDGSTVLPCLVCATAAAFLPRQFDPRSAGPSPQPALTHEALETVLVVAGHDPSAVLVSAFHQSTSYGDSRSRQLLRTMSGYSEAVARHSVPLSRALATGSVADRLVALQMLADVEADSLAGLAPAIAALATSTSAKVRDASGALASRAGVRLREPLRELAANGKPDQRLHALRLLTAHGDDADRAWARRTAGADRAASVQALVQEWDQAPTPLAEAVSSDLRPRPTVDWSAGLTTEIAAWIDRARDHTNRRLAASPHTRHLAPLTDDQLAGVRDRIATGRPFQVGEDHRAPGSARWIDFEAAGADPAATLPALLAFLAEGALFDYNPTLSRQAIEALNAHKESGKELSLYEIAVALDDLGLEGTELVLAACGSRRHHQLAVDWPDEDVAPFVAANLEAVAERLGRSGDWHTDDLAVYRLVGALAELPGALVEALFPVALSGLKTHRQHAQAALRRFPGRDARVITALSDGKGDVRAEAARWIQRDQISAAVPALEKAYATERQDVPKGAYLDALEALGQPIEKYLDRTRLAADAEKSVARGLPKDLDWFPWAGLPSVRWADSGELVPLTLLQHLCAQAVKSRSPEPNTVLRRLCGLFHPRDRVAFGQLVLDAWIAEDLKPVSEVVAQDDASTRGGWGYEAYQRWPQNYAGDPRLGWSREQWTESYLARARRQPVGSATTTKGLLAVAAACAGEGAAASAYRYLQDWYGTRASQGKALIAMLAWVDHPSATQLMLSVGQRFRTKSFQDEATRQAEALAERRGWTVAELADRTIPTAGLDEAGVLHLSYGEREFTAHLHTDLSLELRNDAGVTIKALPAPRQTDDAETVKESKQALTAARKEVKAVVKLQAERLYEALCTEREWSFEDWDRYLNHHPLMHLLVRGLVWRAEDDTETVTFRPLDDHSLTDLDDNEVTIKPGAKVRVAHDTNVDAGVGHRWLEHLTDYEVTPLFQQFGKALASLPDGYAQASSLEDVKGALVESFTLRGRATRLGYTRGPGGDGGIFSTYEKRFPTLGLTTVVEFSGSPLPEESRTVALLSLSFERRVEGRRVAQVRLGDVPTVLLGEAYSDLLAMAGGATPEPGWEQKVHW